MPLSFTLPLFEEKPLLVRDKVFTILTTTFPLSLIQILNKIKLEYKDAPSFQAVRKAVLELVAAKVLIKIDKKFSLSTTWILNLTKYASLLHKQYFTQNNKNIKIEVGSNVTVYTFSRLIDLDFVWNSIIREHFLSHPKPPKRITYEGTHFWFMIVTLAQELELMKEMLNKGITLAYLCYSKTPLDLWAVKQYTQVGVCCLSKDLPLEFSPTYNIGVYGNLIISTIYPVELIKKMDAFFQKNKKIEQVNMEELYTLVTSLHKIQLTVIHDPVLAKNKSEAVFKFFDKNYFH